MLIDNHCDLPVCVCFCYVQWLAQPGTLSTLSELEGIVSLRVAFGDFSRIHAIHAMKTPALATTPDLVQCVSRVSCGRAVSLKE